MPKVIHQEKLCCGYRRCVSIKLLDNGAVELNDDDVEAGSVGTIKLRPEVADRLLELLSERKVL